MRFLRKIFVGFIMFAIIGMLSIIGISKVNAKGGGSKYTVSGNESDAGKGVCSGNYYQLMAALNGDGNASRFLSRDEFQYLGMSCGIGDGYGFVKHTKRYGGEARALTYVTWFKIDIGYKGKTKDGADCLSSKVVPIKSQEYLYTHYIDSGTYSLKLYSKSASNNLLISGMTTNTIVEGGDAYIADDECLFDGFTKSTKMSLSDVWFSQEGFTFLSDCAKLLPYVGNVWSACCDAVDNTESVVNAAKVMSDSFKITVNQQSIRGTNVKSNNDSYHLYPIGNNQSVFAIRPVGANKESVCIKDSSDFMQINTRYIQENKESYLKYTTSATITFFDTYNGKEVTCSKSVSDVECKNNLQSTQTVKIDGHKLNTYKFVAPNTSKYTLETTGSINTYMYLHDSSMNIIANDDDGGNGRNSKIEYTFEKGKTYYISVRSYYSSGVNSYGLCQLIRTTERSNITDGTISFEIEGKTEYQFKYIPSTSEKRCVYTMSCNDTYMYLYDSYMNEITHDDDSGKERNAMISYDFIAGNTYYIGVRGYYDYSSGNCDLIIEKSTSGVSVNNGLEYYSNYASGDWLVNNNGVGVVVSYIANQNCYIALNTVGDFDTMFNDISIISSSGTNVTSSRTMYYYDDDVPSDDYYDTDYNATLNVELLAGDTLSFNIQYYGNGVGDCFLYSWIMFR